MNSFKDYKDFLVREFDLILGIGGSFVGLAIILASFLTSLSQTDIGFTVLLVSFIHVVFRNKIYSIKMISPRLNQTQKLVMDISFVLLFTISLLVYKLDIYYRPLSYFLLIAILVGLIGIEIFCLKEEHHAFPIILKVLLVSFNLRMGLYYNFPSIMGYDAYFHSTLANLVTSSGFVAGIDISTKYFYYPIFHIFISMYQIICDLCAKNAVFFSIGFASILSTIFIYYIGKNIAGIKVGLLAMLLFNFTNFTIVRGIANVTPGSLVLCYFLLIAYLLLQSKLELTNKAFLLLVTFLVVLSHQLTSFVVLLSLSFLYVASFIYKRLIQSDAKVQINFNYVLLFGVALLFYWMATSVQDDVSFFEWVFVPFSRALLGFGGEYGSNVLIVGYQYESSLLETFILHISYLILPFFGIGGVLYCASNKSSVTKYSIAITIILFYLIIYGIPLLGIRNLLTIRWMPIVSFFLVLSSSIYLFTIFNLFTSKRIKLFLMFTIIFVFVFFMITTPSINKDNPLVAKDTTIRNQFTDSEIYAVKTISSLHVNEIVIDSPFSECYDFYGNSNNTVIVSLNLDMVQSKIIEGNPLIVLRKSALKEPVMVKYSELYGSTMATKLTKDFFDTFETKNYVRVYDNGQVLGYR